MYILNSRNAPLTKIDVTKTTTADLTANTILVAHTEILCRQDTEVSRSTTTVNREYSEHRAVIFQCLKIHSNSDQKAYCLCSWNPPWPTTLQDRYKVGGGFITRGLEIDAEADPPTIVVILMWDDC